MVYTCVYLIAGVVIDRKVAYQHDWVDKDGFVNNGCDGIIHPYRCCSILAGQLYILGRIVHIFHRVKMDACGKNLDGTTDTDPHPERRRTERNMEKDKFKVCGKYYACKECLGTTNGGARRWFDVAKLMDEVVEYDPSKVCPACYDVEYVKDQACGTCGHSRDRSATAPAYDLASLVGIPSPKFYLIVDDCLSCT